VENGIEITPGKSKAISLTRTRVEYALNCSVLDQVIRKRAVVNTGG